MRSKAIPSSHPLQSMLGGFPIAFYTATLGAFIVFATSRDSFWLRFANVANWAGVAMAAIALIPGLLDWVVAIPTRSRAKRVGLVHLGLNVVSLLVLLINALVYWNAWEGPLPDPKLGILLSAIGVLLIHPAAFLGWSMVQNHPVGVRLSSGSERVQPMATVGRRQPSIPTYQPR